MKICLAIIVLGLSISSAYAGSLYKLTDTISLPGAVKWDYLLDDSEGKRLYIAHDDRIDVVDTEKNSIVGSIQNVHGAHGIALDREINMGFASAGKDNAIVAFEISSLKTMHIWPVGIKPDAILYDPDSKKLFIANGTGHSLTIIDPVKSRNLGVIALAGKPEFMAVDHKGRLFINIEDKNLMTVVDIKQQQLIANYNLAEFCNEPSGLAIDSDKERLFVGCSNQKMLVVDGNSGKIVVALPIGKHSDAVAYSQQLKQAFSSNGDGTLTVANQEDADHYKISQTVQTAVGARTMAIDPQTHHIYLVSAELDETNKSGESDRPIMKNGTFKLLIVSPQ